MNCGLYIHVPFCEQRCHYCAFPITVVPKSHYPAYTERLVRELEMINLSTTPETLYLGGGTPSLLSSRLIRQVFGALPSGAAEASIEVNPGTLDETTIGTYRDLGINRVSLGAQSFDDADLKSAGRLHASTDTIEDFEAFRRHGFDNINLDLIAGLPEQQTEAWQVSLDWIERLRPEHVSVYLLEAEEGTLWGKRAPEVADEKSAWFYSVAAERLGNLGYRHYEVSNWALPGRECWHNLGYWTGRSYRGVGLGAHSFVDGRRFWNTRSMVKYAEQIDQGRPPVEMVEDRTSLMCVEEAFLLGLRRLDGFDVHAIAEDLGLDYPQEWFERVERLESAGIVEFDGRILKLKPYGWLIAGGVTEELLCPELLSICEAIQ
jgi:oxygen-independent coproporphyrinogen-3 oxidase